MVAEIVLALGGYVVAIFVPGLLWARVLLDPGKSEIWETLAFSLVLGIAVLSTSVFYASFLLRIPTNVLSLGLIIVALSVTPLAILYRREDPLVIKVANLLTKRGPPPET